MFWKFPLTNALLNIAIGKLSLREKAVKSVITFKKLRSSIMAEESKKKLNEDLQKSFSHTSKKPTTNPPSQNHSQQQTTQKESDSNKSNDRSKKK